MFKPIVLALTFLALIIGTANALDNLTTWNNSQSFTTLNFTNFTTPSQTLYAGFSIYKKVNITNATFNITGLNSSGNQVNNGNFETGVAFPWVFENSTNPVSGSAIFNITSQNPISGIWSGRVLATGNWSGQGRFANITINASTNGAKRLNYSWTYVSTDLIDVSALVSVRYQNGTFLANIQNTGLALTTNTGGTVAVDLTQYTNETNLLFNFLLNINGAATNVTANYTIDNVTIWDQARNSNGTINASAGYLWNVTGYLNQANSPLRINDTNFISTLQRYLDSCSADSNGQCNVAVISSSNSSGLVNLTNLYINYTPYAGLYTRARNIDTQALISSNLTITNGTSTFTTLLNSSNSTTFFAWNELPLGSLTLTYSSTGFQNANYFLTNNATNENNLTAELLNTSGPNNIVVRLHILDASGAPIPSATISIFQAINNLYVLIAQANSDGSGTATFTLDSTASYIINVSKAGYNTLSQPLVQPTLNDYNVYLTSLITAPITMPLTSVNVTLVPNNLVLGNNVLYFTVNGTDGLVNFQRVALRFLSNGSIINQSTTSSASNGTNLSITFNLVSGWNQSMVLEGYFNKTNGQFFQQFIIYQNNSYPSSNNASSISKTIEDFSQNRPSYLLTGIIAIIIIALTGSWVYRLSGNGTAAGFTGVILAWVFQHIQFLQPPIAFVMTIGFVGLVYFSYKG